MSMKKILVVDDSPTELTHIQTIVSDAGCEVLTATNGQEAVAKAKAQKPDLIFLDIVMPEQDGYHTCRELSGDTLRLKISLSFLSRAKTKKPIACGPKCKGVKVILPNPIHPMKLLIKSSHSNSPACRRRRSRARRRFSSSFLMFRCLSVVRSTMQGYAKRAMISATRITA